MALTTEQGKALVYELTMEYIKQTELLKCNECDINDRITKIAQISEIIYNAVDKNYHDFKWLYRIFIFNFV